MVPLGTRQLRLIPWKRRASPRTTRSVTAAGLPWDRAVLVVLEASRRLVAVPVALAVLLAVVQVRALAPAVPVSQATLPVVLAVAVVVLAVATWNCGVVTTSPFPVLVAFQRAVVVVEPALAQTSRPGSLVTVVAVLPAVAALRWLSTLVRSP